MWHAIKVLNECLWHIRSTDFHSSSTSLTVGLCVMCQAMGMLGKHFWQAGGPSLFLPGSPQRTSSWSWSSQGAPGLGPGDYWTFDPQPLSLALQPNEFPPLLKLEHCHTTKQGHWCSSGLCAWVIRVRLCPSTKIDPLSPEVRSWGWGRTYDLGGPNYGFNDVGTLDLGVVNASATYWSSYIGVGMLASPKGPRGSCLSSKGRENY